MSKNTLIINQHVCSFKAGYCNDQWVMNSGERNATKINVLLYLSSFIAQSLIFVGFYKIKA